MEAIQPVTIDYQMVLSTVNTNLDFVKEAPKHKTQLVSQVVDFSPGMGDFRSHQFHVF